MFQKKSNKQIQTKTGYRRTDGLTDKHEIIGPPFRRSSPFSVIIVIYSGNNPKFLTSRHTI